MIISELAFLLLQYKEADTNQCTLVSYGSLYALRRIEQDSNVIRYYWNVNNKKVI